MPFVGPTNKPKDLTRSPLSLARQIGYIRFIHLAKDIHFFFIIICLLAFFNETALNSLFFYICVGLAHPNFRAYTYIYYHIHNSWI